MRTATRSLLEPARRLLPAPVKRVVRRFVLNRLDARTPLVPPAALEETYVQALTTLAAARPAGPVGDYVEFGVCRGTSMACMSRATERLGLGGMRLIGFDSFRGLPAAVEDEDGGLWSRGQFRVSERAARRYLRRQRVDLDRVELVAGWFDDTATPDRRRSLGLREVSVAMIDCDAYSSARTALEFVGPALASTAVLVFDDWHSGGLADAGQGERRAFDEFLAAHPEVQVTGRLEPYAPNAEVVVVQRLAPAPPP